MKINLFGKDKVKKDASIDRPAGSPPPDKAAAKSTSVAMFRSAEDAKGGPETADVHPDEVAAWQAAGWTIKEKEKLL